MSYRYLMRYPAPKNIGYLWNIGLLIGMLIVVQLISGLLLSIFYTSNIEFAFTSIEHFVIEFPCGWFVRYIHLNGASFLFFFIYIHLFRGLWYGSFVYPRTHVWLSGVTIYLVLMVVAFLGYVLPWGQMSFWAATVISNMVTVVPIIGTDILFWIWGGYSINCNTLNRFCIIHYVLPFFMIVILVAHVVQLHEVSSSSELPVDTVPLTGRVPFFDYYTTKDIYTAYLLLTAYVCVLCFFPDIFNHTLNYVPADPCITPKHIVPEWYFLPYYGILRSIPAKTTGILVMFASILVFYRIPFCVSDIYIQEGGYTFQSSDTLIRQTFCIFLLNYIFLGFLGSQSINDIGTILGMYSICIYFVILYIYIGLSFRPVAFRYDE